MTTREEAEALIADGWRVWPVSRTTRRPVRAGFARADGPDVTASADEFTEATEVGVLCGPCAAAGPDARFVCVDYDGPVPPEARVGGAPTLTSKQGAHEWYRVPPGVTGFRQSQSVRRGGSGNAAWAVDTRDFGGYARETENGEGLWDDGPVAWPRDITQAEVDALFPPAPEPPRAPPEPPRGPRTEPAAAWVNAFVARVVRNPDDTNACYAACASALVECGWSNAEIAAAFEAWTPGHPTLPGRHLASALRAADTRRAGGVVPGFPRLAELVGTPFATAGAPDGAEDISAILLKADAEGASAATEQGPFKLVSAAEAAEYVLKPVAWLSEQLVMAPGAPSLITGYGGSGKTTFVQHLALAVATSGGRLLGRHQLRHGPVVHIDHEQGLDLTVRRYRAQGLCGREQLAFCSFPQWALGSTDPASREHFVRLCRGRALVIIDSFLASCAGHIDENSSETREPLDFLGKVSDATGAVILVIHHSKKDRSEAMTSARGTSAITDAVSLHLTYEKKELTPGELPTLKVGKTRHEPPPGAFVAPVRVAMAPAGDGYTLVEAAGPTSAEDSADLAVATAMASGERFTSLKAIREAAGLMAASSDAAVRRAIQNGIIVHRNGKYFYAK
jgi:energy-coupling factor transporter ATP-binding protein EcfA2